MNGYKLKKFIGEGATAQVWSAIGPDDKKYALKIFAPRVALDNYSKSLLKEEYEKTKMLSHDNVIAPADYFEHEERPVLVMKLCGPSLWDMLAKRMSKTFAQTKSKDRTNLFSEEELAKVIFDITRALEYIHKRGLVHHDVKPANILSFKEDGIVHYGLTDFGITKEIRETIIRQTKTSGESLTFAYAAPERLQGVDLNDPRSDIFSLGTSIFEITNGIKIPPAQILNNNGAIPKLKGNYSNRFNEFIQRILSKNPADRFTPDQILDRVKFYLRENYWPAIDKTIPKATTESTPSPMRETQHMQESQNTGVNISENTVGEDNERKNKMWLPAAITIALLAMAYFLYPYVINHDNTYNALAALNEYDKYYKINDAYILVEKNGLAGIVNSNNEIVKEIEYEYIYPTQMRDSIVVKSKSSKPTFIKLN